MASFYAYDFIFDETPSQKYDLQIITFDDGGLFSGVGSSNTNIITQSVMRKSKNYFLGRTQEPILEFPLTFGRKESISAMERDAISKWLFGRSGYKKLYILEDDMDGAYFNCFLTNPTPLFIGNLNYAFNCTVTCDSPFAYSPEKTISATYSNFTNLQYTTTIYNASSEEEYIYPNITFTMGSSGSTISIKNITDSNRTFTFGTEDYPLLQDEEVEVNNDLQIIESSTGLRRMSHFNNNWFRLVPGVNQILVSGSVASFEITYNERLKIGG